MDRHSRSPDQSDGRRYGRRRRHSRSRSRSRERRRRYSRSMSRERNYRRGGGSPDYRDNSEQYGDRDRYNRRDRRDRDRYNYRGRASSESSNESYNNEHVNYRNQTPSNKIIVLGLAKHLTEADINADLHMCNIHPQSIRLIRKRKTGASRGFAFVEFNTEEEATRWMEYKQGILLIQDQYRAIMQYSVSNKDPGGHSDRILTDWYCAKCGVFNFKRRDNCFKCNASREESEKGGEGSDEVSNILTKKIMLRNLDVLTNEEGVLTAMQGVIPTLVSKISKILICRDPLTSTSRGICYLFFDNLVDSMNTHNALKSVEPPLNIDNREIIITYCVDSENRQISARYNNGKSHQEYQDGMQSGKSSGQYTLADVPRLAEYSASVYAKNATEQEYYYKYYTDYYTEQINSGQYSNIPSMSQIGETANSGAAVALSAIQRKQHKQYEKISQAQSVAAVAATPLQIPNGQDNRKYATPDTTQYQYDDTSGYYYDPTTGLYYDPNSQYYYNSEIASYLYYDPEKCTYLLASQTDTATSSGTAGTTSMSAYYGDKSGASTAPPANGSSAQPSDAYEDNNKDNESKKNDPRQDKVKVAKKIVKDMERWAKQLNQKKDYAFQPMQQQPVVEEPIQPSSSRQQPLQRMTSNGYADVGFTIMENRETRLKPSLDINASKTLNKLLPYTSDSDNDIDQSAPNFGGGAGGLSEKDLVDFDKLTCLLCKRAFQSLDILNKHIKMSNLHKENLQKLNLNTQNESSSGNGMAYRDRAKERRLKYGEVDPPPPNRSRERFEKEMKKQSVHIQKQASSNLAHVPIDQSNLGNRLLQKMGWKDGQGLGKSNQGRTNIIEAESRAPTAGLGSKTTAFVPGDDYRTYIKRMMKSRYNQSD
ncbi:RNA-binding protein 5-B-like [Sitodiplosis mosellana]|uniref:RNA-binding protein 5-B-like n=1 Tax=Sitodiplosis mosellana TaxID=263140 RepID=UPI00244529FD|nr:RNA-binding protein 5-B-like [Sitodiplosis mosellana]